MRSCSPVCPSAAATPCPTVATLGPDPLPAPGDDKQAAGYDDGTKVRNELNTPARIPCRSPTAGTAGVESTSRADAHFPGEQNQAVDRRRRVAAARLAADRRSVAPFVRAARRAEALRDAAERLCAAVRACCDSCAVDAAARPSCLRARRMAWERFEDFARFFPRRPCRNACWAARRVRADVFPGSGGGRLTPARLAFDSPMAIACLVERAPCLPSRTCSISSRTNSPACVDGARPARFAWRARFSVVLLGIAGQDASSAPVLPNLDRYAVDPARPSAVASP
jgi:hypothetical protein